MSNPKIEHFPRKDGDPKRSFSSSWLHRISFEQGVEPVFIFDATTRIVVDVNRGAVELTGYDREELLDLRLEDLHPRSSRENVIRYFQKILDHGTYVYDDLPLETKQETEVPVEVKAGLLSSSGGQVVEAVFRDISKDRLLQKEVLFQNLKLSALNSLSSAISKSLDLTEILSYSLRAIMEASGCIYGEMLLHHAESGTFKLATYNGEGVDLRETDLPAESCPLAEQVIDRGKPVLLERLDLEPRLERILGRDKEVAAVAGVPLRSKD